MVERDFGPRFYAEHFNKDLGIAVEEARTMNASLPGLALIQQLYQGMMAHGDGQLGTQGILKLYEKLNNIEKKD